MKRYAPRIPIVNVANPKVKDFPDAWERYLSGTDGTDLKNKGLLNNLSGTKSKGVPQEKERSKREEKTIQDKNETKVFKVRLR